MNDALRVAAAPAVVPEHERGSSTHEWWLGATGRTLERERLEHRAAQTTAAVQLRRCLPRWARMLEQLSSPALTRLAENQPIDPNVPDTWRNRDVHAEAVLRRHGLARVNASRLTSAAVGALIEGPAQADRDAGID